MKKVFVVLVFLSLSSNVSAQTLPLPGGGSGDDITNCDENNFGFEPIAPSYPGDENCEDSTGDPEPAAPAPVVSPRESALVLAENELEANFYQILFAIKPDSSEIEAFSNFLEESAIAETAGLTANPDPLIAREIAMIKKIRYLQNIGTAYTQGSIREQNRVIAGYFFSLDGEVDLGLVKIAGSVPLVLSLYLQDYFSYNYVTASN